MLTHHRRRLTSGLVLGALAALLLAACKTPGTGAGTTQTPTPPPAAVAVIRIDAGSPAAYKDSAGNTWLADQGFEGGDTVDRGEGMVVTGTKDPALFRTEHWGMSGFSTKVPNGKYTVKLYFAETYVEGDSSVSGPGMRVFSFNVQGKNYPDFDVWAKAGGGQKAYVETVKDVAVTDGTLKITFAQGTQVQPEPEINAIEIIPN